MALFGGTLHPAGSEFGVAVDSATGTVEPGELILGFFVALLGQGRQQFGHSVKVSDSGSGFDGFGNFGPGRGREEQQHGAAQHQQKLLGKNYKCTFHLVSLFVTGTARLMPD
jgi:hypothetical protein